MHSHPQVMSLCHLNSSSLLFCSVSCSGVRQGCNRPEVLRGGCRSRKGLAIDPPTQCFDAALLPPSLPPATVVASSTPNTRVHIMDLKARRLLQIDATEEKALAERFEVKGFPTLKWIVNGEAMEYGGGRDE